MAFTEARKRSASQSQEGLLARIPRSSRLYWLRLLLENRAVVVSLSFIGVVLVAAILAPVIADHDPLRANPRERLLPPSGEHWAGTDDLGRDSFARLLFGARVSLLIGLSVTMISGVIGTVIGLVAAFYNRLDNVVMRVMDGFMAFPSILLAIAIMASLGPRASNVVIALVVVNTPRVARLGRGAALVIKAELYVEAARSIGVSDMQIIRRHVLPNSLSPLIVQCTFIIAIAIISEAALSFLGAGVPPQNPTWGNMLRDGQRLISSAWWMSVFPGSALFLTVLAFNLIGDGLRDALDPRGRGR